MTLGCRRAFVAALLTLVLASCDSTVEPVLPVATTITLLASSLSLSSLGDAQQLSATVRDQAGDVMSGVSLSWASLSQAIATVSDAGLVTAVANGSTMVTVTSGSASAAVSVTVDQIAVSITLSRDTVSFSALGDTVLVAASVEDAGGSDVADAVIVWTSLDPAVATVSPAGVFTAIANGTTAVTAISESLLGTVSVTVSQLPAAIALSADSVDFAALGDTAQLVASVSDSSGSAFGGAIVTWTTSDATVAIVSGIGLVTAIDNGVATVTATSGSVTDSATVTVQQVVAVVALLPDSVVLGDLGETTALVALVRDPLGAEISAPTVTWTSGDGGIATVDSAGVVTAVANGSTMVTAMSGSVSATASVTVAQIAVSIALSLDTASFSVLGDTLLVTASVRDSGGSDVAGAVVTWRSLDPAIATVSPAGWLTAVANGTTAVTAISESLLATVSVTVSQLPASLALSAEAVDFAALGDTTQLEATVSDSNGSVFGGAIVTWTTSDSTVASVSGTGLVTAVDNGVATVTATSGPVTDTSTVTVQQVVAAVALLPDSVVLGDLGETAALMPLVQDPLGAEIVAPTLTWMSGDMGIAAVDASGIVTAISTGTVWISATSGGVSASISARVVPELTLVAASPGNLTAEVASPVSLSVRVEDVLAAAYAGATVTWSVDSGAGTITSATQSLSDATGHAGAVWALGPGTGTQLASASIVTRGSVVVVAFVADAFAGAATNAFLVADSVLLSAAGETVFLAPSFLDQYGNTATPTSVTWNSSDPSVAMVAADGLVTGQGSGTTYVTALLGSPTDSILVTVVPRGAITVTFDDGWLTTHENAWSVMQEFDLRGNVAVYTEAVDFNFPAYMDLTQLQDLHDDGWSMVSHTVSHDSLSTLSMPVLDFELRTSQQWLIDRGFDRASHIFIAPYHIWPDSVRPAVATYYAAARGVSANASVPDSLVSWRPSNPYDLTAIPVDQLPYTTVEGRNLLQAMLQRTRDEGRFLDVLFHQVPAQNVPALRETLMIINTFRDRVLPYHELYPKFARVVG